MKQSNAHTPEESKKILIEMDIDLSSEYLAFYAQEGRITEIIHLINAGIHPDSISNDGFSPIASASQQGHLNIVEILLDKGANPNLLNQGKWSALYLAALGGHIGVVELLIKKGANINGSYAPPIIGASQEGHLNIVEILLDKGANPNLLNSQKCSALSLAALGGYIGVVELLIKKGANINGSSEENFIPIIQALEGNHLNVIETLVSNGANVEIRDNEGNKPLTIAHKSKNNMAYDKLVRLGATPLSDEEKKQTQFFSSLIVDLTSKLLDDLKEIYSKKHYIFLSINALCFIVFIFVINEDNGGGLFSRLIAFLVCVCIGGLAGWYSGRNQGAKEGRIRGFKGGAATLLIFVTIIMWSNNNYVPSSGGRSSNTCSQCGDSFSGKGWSSIAGEQFKCNDRQCIYCSRSCAYDSQSLKWKLSH